MACEVIIPPHVTLFVGVAFLCLSSFVLIQPFCFSQFTEYLMAFCIQNEKAYPNSKEVNSALTQQITHARVKAGRKAKIVDITGLLLASILQVGPKTPCLL